MKIVSAMAWREDVTFNEMVIISALYSTNTLYLISIVLAHWHNSRTTQTNNYESHPSSLCDYSL